MYLFVYVFYVFMLHMCFTVILYYITNIVVVYKIVVKVFQHIIKCTHDNPL